MGKSVASHIERVGCLGKRGMRRALRPLFLAAPLLTAAASAQAGQYTLLGLRDFRQNVAASYNYYESVSSHKAGRISSSMQGLTESYGVGVGYSILHPSILKGEAQVEIAAEQEADHDNTKGGSSSNDKRIEYGIKGIFLSRGYSPVSFSSSSATITARPQFSNSYRVETANQNLIWNLKNRTLPASLSLSKVSSVTDGRQSDTSTQSQTVQIAFGHDAGSVSHTTFSLGMSSHRMTLLQTGLSEDYREASSELTNLLSWYDERALRRTVDTRFVIEQRSGRNAGTHQSVGSNVQWQLGKALSASLSGSKNRNDDSNGTSDSQGIAGSLSHKFLQAIYTNLGGSFTKGDFSDGSDTTRSSNAGVRYDNELPGHTLLSLGYNYNYSIQDRERTALRLNGYETVTLEPVFPQYATLSGTNIDTSTVQLYLDPGRSLPFTDFTVVDSGFATRLMINSNPGASLLYAAYSYRQSPRVKFATTAQNVSGRLLFLGGRHSVHADYNWSGQEIMGGSDPSATLAGSSQLRVGWEMKAHPHTASVNYSAIKSSSQDLQNVDLNWTHVYQSGPARLSTHASDRYSWYPETGSGGGKQRWDNSLLVSSTYSRPLIRNFKGSLKLGYFNLTSDSANSNMINTEVGLDGRYGKTSVTLESSFNLGFSSSGYSRNQSVMMKIRRMF
uniref:TIGR03016 family PEP-CTERM system-associated outer membrane protein n=1 Tax=Geobacter sp. (strain M21) TaxID=443144 RepID=C6E3E6_GEOSM